MTRSSQRIGADIASKFARDIAPWRHSYARMLGIDATRLYKSSGFDLAKWSHIVGPVMPEVKALAATNIASAGMAHKAFSTKIFESQFRDITAIGRHAAAITSSMAVRAAGLDRISTAMSAYNRDQVLSSGTALSVFSTTYRVNALRTIGTALREDPSTLSTLADHADDVAEDLEALVQDVDVDLLNEVAEDVLSDPETGTAVQELVDQLTAASEPLLQERVVEDPTISGDEADGERERRIDPIEETVLWLLLATPFITAALSVHGVIDVFETAVVYGSLGLLYAVILYMLKRRD
ncbi:MAG: hypothetical protein GEV10_16100 [Streptosporangiales bacterium]|nr:hypothetical protein [Streptosporangiales bacterium]